MQHYWWKKQLLLWATLTDTMFKAGTSGMASTALAVPVFREKMVSLEILTYACACYDVASTDDVSL